MATRTLYPITVTTAASPVARATSSPIVATSAGERTEWRVVIVDRYGTPVVEVPPIDVSVTWPLDEPADIQFAVPMSVRFADEIRPLVHEAQVWRNGAVVAWGPIVARQRVGLDRTTRYQAHDVLWYLTRRHIGDSGPTTRTNLLTNGDFEDGTTGWTNVGVDTFSTTLDDSVIGTRSAALNHSPEGENAYIRQRISIDAGRARVLVRASAWAYLFSYQFTGPAFRARGLWVARQGTGADVGVVKQYRNTRLGASTQKKRWLRQEAWVVVPAGFAATIELRLYAIGGNIRWDAASLIVEDGLIFTDDTHWNDNKWDQTSIIRQLVNYAQGRPIPAIARDTEHSKSDLNIDVVGALTGRTRNRRYRYSDHWTIRDAIDEFLTAWDGVDVSVEYTPTTRRLQIHYPQRGAAKDELLLTYFVDPDTGRSSGNIVTYELDVDGRDSANQVRILAERHGYRDEAGDEDLDYLDGLTLEAVEEAPPRLPIALLDERATQRVVRLRSTVRILRVVVPIDPADVEPGDTIPVRIADGDVSIDADWRVASVAVSTTADGATAIELVEMDAA